MDYNFNLTTGAVENGSQVPIHGNTTETSPQELAALVILLTMRIIFSGLGFFSNGLMIYSVYRFTTLRTSTTLLLTSNAVVEFFSAFLVFIDIPIYFYYDKVRYLVQIGRSGYQLCSRFSFSFIIWISLDRLIYIAYPLKYALWVTIEKVAYVISISITLGSLEVGIFSYLIERDRNAARNMVKCYTFPINIVSLVIVSMCHVMIGLIASKQANVSATNPVTTLESNINSRQRALAKMTFLVVLIQITCALTLPVIQVIMNVDPNVAAEGPTLPMRLGMLIFHMKSFINPAIYYWKYKPLKTAFKKVLNIHNNEVQPTPLPTVG